MSDKRFDYERRIALKLKPWAAPNFAVVDDNGNGDVPGSIHVRDLPYDTLEAMIRHWGDEVRAIAATKTVECA